jgi:hypothetical protein
MRWSDASITSEAEVVLDPRRLRKLTIKRFDGKELFAEAQAAEHRR